MILEFSPQTVVRASDVIARGGIIAFRTDTFYGLGADPFNRDAVRKIKQLKGSSQPILIVISDREQIERFIPKASPVFDLLAANFWPGPLTLIDKAAPGVPGEITAGTGTIGLRLPDDDRVRELLRSCGGVLTATSANPSHQEPARTAKEVQSYFGNAIDLIVDGGFAGSDQPSTVVDVCGVEPRLIREGIIAWTNIRTAIDRRANP